MKYLPKISVSWAIYYELLLDELVKGEKTSTSFAITNKTID
jgi:hypothetical protein